MDGFTRRKEQSKEDIRKAAWDLFSQFGVERVSIIDIAKKAGVSQATIYNNFGSKETLSREFVSEAVDQLVQRVKDVLSPGKDYPEKMAAFLQFISDAMVNMRPSAVDNAMFTHSLDLLNDPEIKRIRQEAQKQMTTMLLELIHTGKDAGLVNPDLSDDALEIYFTAFMDLFTNPELKNRFQHYPELVRELGVMMTRGLQ